MYCKLTFCESSSKNMVNLTILQDEILTLIPNTMNRTENDVKKHLIEVFDELIVIKNNVKVVASVELVQYMCY